MSVPNIAFVGKAGAGKTEAAAKLQANFPELGFEIISFAGPMKVMLNTVSDRARLQQFGTDIVRRYERDAWVRLFLWQLDLRTRVREAERAATAAATGGRPLYDGPVRWCCDDVRFPNEVIELQDAGWKIIEVRASRQVRIDRLRRNGKLTDEAQLLHSTETALDRLVPDAVIINDDTPEYLTMSLSRVLEDLSR